MSARLHWGDGYLKVFMDLIPEDLTNKLRYWHKQLAYDPAVNRQIVQGEYRNLYSTDVLVDDDQKIAQCLLTMPGFMHRVKSTLTELQIPFSIVDERTPCPEPNIEAALSGLHDYQWECAHTALMSGGGIVACPTGWGKTHIISAIVRAFSHEDMCARGTPLAVVTCAEKEIARQNAEVLQQVLPHRDVGLVMSGSDDFSDDIQIITLDSMKRINADEIGILIVDEVHTAATPTRSEYILKARKAMVWGASATPTGRFDGGDLLTEGMIGPVVYHRTYQAGVQDGALVPIKVYWINCPEPKIGMQRYNNFKTRRGKMNNAIIKGDVQNEIVGELLKRIPTEMQTLCIMQQTQQMNEIVPLVDGIRYVHAKTTDKQLSEQRQYNLIGVTTRERKKRYEDFKSGKIRKILATHVYKQGVDFPNLEIMICPGGGGSEIVAGQVPGRGSRRVAGKDAAYMIDFWHSWDETPPDLTKNQRKPRQGPLLRDDRERDRIYESLGFERHWIDSIEQLPFIKETG